MRRLVLGIAVAVTSLIPVMGMADDQRIADFIKGRLQAEQQQGNLRGFNVDMRVEQGTVWFKGHVSNSDQEMTILKTAQAAGHLGVVKVVDDIEAKAVAPEPAQSVFSNANYEPAQPAQAPPFQQSSFQQQAPQSSFQQPSFQQPQPRTRPRQPSPYRQASSRQEFFGGYDAGYGGGVIDGGVIDGGYVGDYGGYAGDYGGYVGDYGGGYVGEPISGDPLPFASSGGGGAPLSFGPGAGASEAPNLPGYAWPGYAASPNYGAVAYPKQHSASAWPYIGPFYPYPQVPLGWRKVSLEWDDGFWMLDFHDK